MCEPTTALAAISILGTSLNAQGSRESGMAANSAAEYNARIHENNAKYAELEAQDIEKVGKADEARFRQNVTQMKGAQRAGFAASGVLVDSGSAQDTAMETTKQGELDALTIRNNSAKSAWAARMKKQDYLNQAQLSRMSKGNPNAAATGTFLSGASQTGLSLYRSKG